MIELHFWNEHVSTHPSTARSLGNAVALRRRLRISLELLGERMAADHRYDEIRAIHARIVLNLHGREGKLISVAQRYGFEHGPSIPSGVQRCHDLLENLLIYGLIWAFNRPLLRQSVGRLNRADLWMSRSRFLALYGRPLLEESRPSQGNSRVRREGTR